MNLMLKNLDNSTTVISAKEFKLYNPPKEDFYNYTDGEREFKITGLTSKMITKIVMNKIAGFILQQTGEDAFGGIGIYKVVNVLQKVASVKGNF